MKMKRLFTLVLSLMMILSLSAPASAIDGENVYTKEEISSTITGAGNVSLWYCQDHVENNNRTYACSVVALCNLAKYYRERGYDKISRSFTTLYDGMTI